MTETARFPSADDYAMALVSACRLTGENPESFIDRAPEMQARHYALHALCHLFPAVQPKLVADLLGAPGRPSFFMRTSQWHVLGLGPNHSKVAIWWSNDRLGQVIESVRARRPAVNDDDKDEPLPPRTPMRIDLGVTKLARPAPSPQPPPATQRAAPPVKATQTTQPKIVAVSVERNGIIVDIERGVISFDDRAEKFSETEIKLLALLTRVSPALLGDGQLCVKVYGRLHADAGLMIRALVEACSDRVERLGLRIRCQPKIGYSLAPI